VFLRPLSQVAPFFVIFSMRSIFAFLLLLLISVFRVQQLEALQAVSAALEAELVPSPSAAQISLVHQTNSMSRVSDLLQN